MRMALKLSGFFGFSKRLKRSSIIVSNSRCDARTRAGYPPAAHALRRTWASRYRANGPSGSAKSPRGDTPPPCGSLRTRSRGLPVCWTVFDQLDVQGKALELLHHHVEGFGEAGLEDVFALDDGFVHARSAGDVVRFYGEHFLERVGGAVRFQGPHFHFAEA